MKNLRLRMPDELHERLVDDAYRNHRSLNSEILYRLDPEGYVNAEIRGLSKEAQEAIRKMITKK